MPQISQENLDRLLKAEKLLLALKEYGVEDWKYYDEACELAFPEEEGA